MEDENEKDEVRLKQGKEEDKNKDKNEEKEEKEQRKLARQEASELNWEKRERKPHGKQQEQQETKCVLVLSSTNSLRTRQLCVSTLLIEQDREVRRFLQLIPP